MQVQTLKGFRDFLPGQARKRQYVINTFRRVFESYGFEPLETPALEYEELLMGKYGDEGDKLMYRFTDNGDRRVAMRYDQTVPLARVVAQYQNELVMPFKRYQIQPVWRAENTQKGRFREFMQCDIDTTGTTSPLADSEIVAVVLSALNELGFSDARIRINDRSVFEGLTSQAISTIDKLKKIGKEKVKEELIARGYDGAIVDQITEKSPTLRIEEIFKYLEAMGVKKDFVTFDPTLARGLDYYTGMIIEAEIPSYTVGSVGGGGRYDNLIGLFANRQIPAVGFAFGFDRIIEAMEEAKLLPETMKPSTQILMSIFSKEFVQASLGTASTLRKNGIAVEVYTESSTPIEKQIKYATRKGIPFIGILGEQELKENKVTIKNLEKREQTTMTVEEAIQLLNAS